MAQMLIDTDTLSEVMRGRNQGVRADAAAYLVANGHFTFTIITRYEILRGLKAKNALRQIEAFEDRCSESHVLPLTDDIVIRAADIYADLYRRGALISDADILIAATALVYDRVLVTGNLAHFVRINGLQVERWGQK